MSKALLEKLQSRFPDALRETYTFRGDDVAIIDAARTVEICNSLKFDPETDMKLLLSVTAVDYLGQTPRFEVITHMTSMTHHHRLRLRAKVPSDEEPKVPSIANLWRGANWWERQIFDLYGIRFEGHPNLRRLYMPEDWKGHPLRKDYPTRLRQPIVPERGIQDLIRGPGPHPGTPKLPVLKG
jgi:NADH-quinone oxidoreductase subunit C